MENSRLALSLRLRAIGDRLRGSLLLWPMLMLASMVGAYLVVKYLDERYATAQWPFVLQLTTSAAVSLLGTIAGATITTAGVVFSLLVVSLQLASGQFSPRVLRGFYRDRLGQMVIGLLTATFAYCVLALSQVDEAGDNAPPLTIELAMLLGLSSIIAIVAYLDRISRRQYVGSIAERTAQEAVDLIEEVRKAPFLGTAVPAPNTCDLGTPMVVTATEDGWVQQLSMELVVASVPPGSVVRLETRVGAYVVRGAPLVTIWPAPASDQDQLRGAFIVGDSRTMQQDIDFGLRQLADIALKALSPAVNDPTTAIEILMRIASIMRRLLLVELPPQSMRCARDVVLLTPWELDHEEYVRHAFDQLRQAAAAQTAVATALVRTMRMLIEVCHAAGGTARVPVLEQQIELTIAGCERVGLLEADIEHIRGLAYRPQRSV